MFWIGFTLGTMLGGIVGIVTVALLGSNDERREK